ncbi:MAG TPA: CHAP domain-containing protein [Candidatus Saccharimonas sp.]|nr:CHAP domain-containing protein [Candidatus Saccharimonas sp.]
MLPASTLADSFDVQINALKQQAAAQQSAAAAAHQQADGYQAQVNSLNAQIAYMQTQIDINTAKSAKVQAQIADATVQMASQKAILSENIKTQYLDSNITPLEMLASSNNLSAFFDAQQYRDKVKDKIENALAEIVALKKSLDDQQAQLTKLIADAADQRAQLAASQAQVSALLALAQQNAAAADAQVRNSNAQISSLKAQQAAALAAQFGSNLFASGSCGGGYPARWCNAGQDTIIDNWGMFNRECVSYAAFKVAVSGRRMPYWGGHGNANQWVDNARASGIPVSGTPRVGDVAISLAGPYGHAMYVESVLKDGRVHVSQFNYGNRGEYSEMIIPASGLYFLHF